jgi:hypothetical protein
LTDNYDSIWHYTKRQTTDGCCIEKTRHDERKTEKLARVSRKVLTFAADFENKMKKHD